jgi:hypothetical protein
MTTLGPPFFTAYNPSGDNSVICTDFTVGYGETKAFNIQNVKPPGGMGRTIGFWKNWAACSKGGQKPILDQTLALSEPAGIEIGDLILHGSTATPEEAPNCTEAERILNKSAINSGKKLARDPAFNLAAQLLAAKLNSVAGTGTCSAAVNTTNDAQALLDAVEFNGISHLTLTTTQTTQANTLATTLDGYNNNSSAKRRSCATRRVRVASRRQVRQRVLLLAPTSALCSPLAQRSQQAKGALCRSAAGCSLCTVRL